MIGWIFLKKKNLMSRRGIHRRRFKCFVKHLKNRALLVSRNAASVAPQHRLVFTRWVGGIDPHTGCADFTRTVKVVPSVMTGVTDIYVKPSKSTPYAPVVQLSVEEILLKLKAS